MNIEKYFPKDIQTQTWEYLNAIDLCCISQVCKSFQKTSSDNRLWNNFLRNPISNQNSKSFYISEMKTLFKNFQKHKKIPPIFKEQLLNPKNPKNIYYKQKFPFLLSPSSSPSLSNNNQKCEYDYLFKFLLIGDSAVGKSSLLIRFSDNMFRDSYISTIGVDFKVKTIEFKKQIIKLQIWDTTAGPERFRTVTSSYYRGAHAIFIVADITYDGAANVENWLNEIERYGTFDVSTMIVLNKKDLLNENSDPFIQKKYHSLGEKHRIPVIETSAKTGENVETMFLEQTHRVFNGFHGISSTIKSFPETGNFELVISNMDSFLESIRPIDVKLQNERKSGSSCILQ